MCCLWVPPDDERVLHIPIIPYIFTVVDMCLWMPRISVQPVGSPWWWEGSTYSHVTLDIIYCYRYAFVNAQDKCAACGFPLMMRGFYIFPCNHKFHNDCLIGEVRIFCSRLWIRCIQLLLHVSQIFFCERSGCLENTQLSILNMTIKLKPNK